MGSRGFCSKAPRCVHWTPPCASTSEHMSCVCSPPEASACLLCPSPEGRGGATGIGNVREASYQPSSRGSVPLQVPLAGALQHEPPDAEWPGPLWHPATTRGTRGQPLAPPCGSAGQQPAWGQFSPLLGARWINLRSRWVNPKPPLLHLHLYFKWPMGEKHFKITFEVKVLGKAQRSQSRFLTKAGWPCLCPHPRGQCCLPFQSPGGPQNPLLFLQEADRIKLLHKHLIYT